MKLLIFAHRGEAQAFLDHWEFSPVDFYFSNLFRSKNYFLLITGEGLKEASEKTIAVCAKFRDDISEIINIGVAGSLSPKLKVGDVTWIRSSYAEGAKKIEFKSFITHSSSKIDCISAFNRITSLDEKKTLSSFADVVDRELWSIMSAAQLFKIPAQSLKIISDELESKDFCTLVKEDAPRFSKKLLDEFRSYESVTKEQMRTETSTENKLEDNLTNKEFLYFTTSQKRKLNTLIKSHSIKNSMSEKEILNLSDELIELYSETKSAKDIAKIFLNELSDRLNPLNTKIREQISKATKTLSDSGIQVIFDQDLEDDYIQLNYQIRSARDQKKLILALEHFNYQKYKNIFLGKIEDDV